MKKSIIFACLLLTIAPFACKKKEDAVPTKTDMLTSKTWKFKSITSDGKDASIVLKACEKDDMQKYNTDGTYVNTDAGTKCSPSGDDKGTWKFINNETMLVEDDDTSRIEELSGTTLRLSQLMGTSKNELTLTNQ